MSKTLIANAIIINEGVKRKGSVLINNNIIEKIYKDGETYPEADNIIDATDKLLLPGIIDDQVHFREPGLTHKGDIHSESRAAVAGGVTSFMEMPNTIPQTITLKALEEKYSIASENSFANYSFYFGATNDNTPELTKLDPGKVCGVKVFMGSSTGNMLVDNDKALSRIFSEAPTIVTTHCEDEATIKRNTEFYRKRYGENISFKYHPAIRSAEACYISSAKAAELASKYGTQLHILHLSTAKEMALFDNNTPLEEKNITGEVCVHHLWFTDEDYDKYGSRIKWNPAIKSRSDRDALRDAVNSNKLDIVATDHAPHTIAEKNNTYFKAPSGGPLVQHSLVAMLEMVKQGIFTYEKVVEKMCHAPAILYRINKRGFIREGYFADLTLIEPAKEWTVSKDNILYKCGWSPFEGIRFTHKVYKTFINGKPVYDNGIINENIRGSRLSFNR
ncbi:MAG: dihydroorotase [Chlorobi bacterium]|nr:dihydroorotase [Chlorobiota bacterium]